MAAWLKVLLVLLLGLWVQRFWTIYQQWGLFSWLGNDFAWYWAQAVLLRSEPARIYDLEPLGQTLQALKPFVHRGDLTAGPVPYPPLYAWLFGPLSMPHPLIGYGGWMALNVLGVAWLAFRCGQLLPRVGAVWLFIALLVSAPITMALFNGQPVILLGCAFGEAFLALRAQKERNAGLWLSLLAFKPQYAILMGPVLLLKRRWTAVGWTLAGVAAIVVASLVVVGLEGVLRYPSAIQDVGDFYGSTQAAPRVMINWRALILELRPTIGLVPGLGLTVLLSALTILVLIPVWRGSWRPAAPEFPAQVAATMVATLLANYHSNVHGGALLAVPFAAVLAVPTTMRVTRISLVATAVLWTLWPVGVVELAWNVVLRGQPVDVVHWAPLVPLLLAVSLGCLVVESGVRVPGLVQRWDWRVRQALPGQR